MVKRIEIIVVEPSAIIRCGVVTLLQQAQIPSVEIAEVADISAVTSGSYRHSPDVVIINTSLLGLYSISQLRSEIGGGKEMKIIAIQSSFVDESRLYGYDEVISIFDSEESVKDKIRRAVVPPTGETESKKELSQREKEIIVCVVKGMTNKQIADTLCISTHTVIAHRRNISNKLQIHSPSGLTIFAIVNKLVDLADIKNSISKGE